jgi:single stranded DNA-binding protein
LLLRYPERGLGLLPAFAVDRYDVVHVGDSPRANGSAVTNFTIAVNRRTTREDAVDYIDIVAWDKLAETSNAYLKKGMPVLVEGRLSIRSYESKSGEKHKAAEVVISFMQMLKRAQSEDAVSGFGPEMEAEPEPTV